MNLLRLIKQRLYYRLSPLMLRREAVIRPAILSDRRNIFIYFDYEREFGGVSEPIPCSGITGILKTLEKYNIKTTWFTVGEIFEKYPNSIIEIVSGGHEIGSHTFSHIPPLFSTSSQLSGDFERFGNAAKKSSIVPVGFHSPNGLWSLKSIQLCALHNYIYDMITCSSQSPPSPLIVSAGRNASILRFCSLGDDWPLYKADSNRQESLSYLKSLLLNVKPGTACGIGFHPWILISSNERLAAFEQFIEYLSQQPNVTINTAAGWTAIIEERAISHD